MSDAIVPINKYFAEQIGLTHMSLQVKEAGVGSASLSIESASNARSPSPEWFLINSRTGSALSLKREMIFVGRIKCDVILEAGSIDNRHAVLCFNPKDRCVYLRDLNTVHGTFVNGTRLTGASYVKIKTADQLQFGLSPEIFVISDKSDIPSVQRQQEEPASDDIMQNVTCDDVRCKKEDSAPDRVKSREELARLLSSKLRSSPSSPAPEAMIHSLQTDSDQSAPQNQEKEDEEHIQKSEIQEQTLVSADVCNIVNQKVEVSAPEPESKCYPAAFTISFDDASDEKKKGLTLGQSLQKFVPKKTFEKIQNRRHSKPPSTHSNQSPVESYEPRSLPIMTDAASKPEAAAQLSDSAVFLIQRMFDSEKAARRGDEDDNKSEAGTYTLEVEDENRDVIRARQMIDNVFGIESKQYGLGSVPSSPLSCHKVRSSLHKDVHRPNIDSLNDETRSRTFTRSKPRRGSLQEDACSSPGAECIPAFDQTFSSRNKTVDGQRKPMHSQAVGKERRDSCTSSKSDYSSKTIEVKTATVINQVRPNRAVTESPRPRRREGIGETRNLNYADSFSDTVSSDAGSTGRYAEASAGGLKLNRAFALRRARLGIETPGVPLNLSGDKQKRNQDNKNRNSNCRSESSLCRQDGGRFSLRVGKSRGKPPVHSSYPSSPEKRSSEQRKHLPPTGRPSSEVQHEHISPASSSSSIPNPHVQRSSSFGPHSATSRQLQSRAESSDRRSTTPMHLMNRRMQNMNQSVMSSINSMMSSRPQQQQQQQYRTDSMRNKQQANVAPIKRNPESGGATSSVMTTSLNEQMQDQAASSPPVIQRRTLSSLDNLVVSAILQLSGKLRLGMREWLEQEKVKYVPGSETRLMIDEILPQVSNITASLVERTSSSSDNLSKDLSTILKNLKKVEQSLEVISLLAALEPTNLSNRVSFSVAKDSKASNNFNDS